MFKLFRAVREAKADAEESIRRSEAEAAVYHQSLSKNADAHEGLMRQLDRRLTPRTA